MSPVWHNLGRSNYLVRYEREADLRIAKVVISRLQLLMAGQN